MASRFYETLTEAIRDIADHGYDSTGRIEHWITLLREAAAESMTPPAQMEAMLRASLNGVYHRMIDDGGVLKQHKGVPRFTLEKVRPALRAELDRRLLAAADLIKLNREEAIRKTLHRFAAWSTSIPAGGSDAVKKQDTKRTVRKALTSLPFEERRVLIDQGHKLRSSLSEVLATGGGAIAGIWHSHWRQSGYNYREDHKDRDGKFYVVRGNWALERGLMTTGPYVDEITRPGEEVNCRCYYQWLHNLRDLPNSMLTKRGKAA